MGGGWPGRGVAQTSALALEPKTCILQSLFACRVVLFINCQPVARKQLRVPCSALLAFSFELQLVEDLRIG